MIEEKKLLPSNCLTLNVLFVVVHQASLIYWQNFRLSAMLIVITHHIKFLKVLNVQSRWFTDNRVMLSPCVESASEEKSAEISMGQQDRGTLVFYFSPPPKQFSNRNSHLLLSSSNQLPTETVHIFAEMTRLFRQRLIYNLELF